MATAWTADDDERLTALHGEGRSLHSIAAEMKRSKHTISTKAKKLGLSWDRGPTAKAAQAVVVDNRARRATITSRMLGRVEHLQDRLEAPSFKTTLKGEGGRDDRVDLDFVPTPDERNIGDTISRYVVSVAKFEAIDAAAQSSGVRDLLTGLAGKLGITDGG